MAYYRDVRDHIRSLEKAGKLTRVTEEINKDTELMPLVRWQFRGLPEEERRAFLFENVTDTKGRRYSIPVLVGALAASREIYALGLMCRPEEIAEKWAQAELHPIEPRLVPTGPVHEEVHIGDRLVEKGGLEEFPIPISTPGFDVAPYTTASHWFTKDPETGIINIGNYRGQVKSPTRTGVFVSSSNHGGQHWKKCKAKGIPLEAALVIGAPPAVAYTAPSRIPYGVSELGVAGALAGEPVEVVRCKTIDMVVPAWAEIVIEGEISTEYLEPEAPFGEATGHVGYRQLNPFFEVRCITHRTDPIFAAIVSQMPPSESSKIKQLAAEGNYYKFLKHNCNIPGILEVAFHEIAVRQICVIRMKKTNPAQPWQALQCTVGFHPATGKIVIVVDEDIDPHDPEAVLWALAFRMQPHRDMQIVKGRTPSMDPSAAPHGALESSLHERAECSALLIDATRKWDYTPVSLPKKEYMERARVLWEKLGLPSLTPRVPWFGYELGLWTAEDEEEAQLALEGEHFQTGAKVARQRVKLERKEDRA